MYLHGKVELGMLKGSASPLQCKTIYTLGTVMAATTKLTRDGLIGLNGGVEQWLGLNSSVP